MVRPEKMQRHIRLVPDHPTVVRDRRDVENIAGRHFDDRPVAHRGDGAARNDHAHVLDIAQRRARQRSDVFRPLPAGLVTRAPDGQPADPDDIEPALLEQASFVRILESLENHFQHFHFSENNYVVTTNGL